jgi:hypothetical protein
MSARPGMNDASVVAKHMEAIREQVRQYLIQDGEPEPDMEQAMEDVARAMKFEFDGYRIAQDLEHLGWNADAQLVELMETLGHERSEAHRAIVHQWVIDEGITPKLAVGDQVSFTQRRPEGNRFEGEITKIDGEHAQYLINVPSLGHVRDGTHPDKKRGMCVYGTFVPFEDVERR